MLSIKNPLALKVDIGSLVIIFKTSSEMTARSYNDAETPEMIVSSRKYQIIPSNIREQLITLVEGGVSIYATAQTLGVNYSTAKAIVRQYRAKERPSRRKKESTLIQNQTVLKREQNRQENSPPQSALEVIRPQPQREVEPDRNPQVYRLSFQNPYIFPYVFGGQQVTYFPVYLP